jgi:CDP-paratose 2-epimerase
LQNEPITIYGDGCQVRDVLFVEDLVNAMLLAQDHAARLAGTAFNIGGGVTRTTSLLELIELIRTLCDVDPDIRLQDWRVGDQRYYVSDARAFQRATGWRPEVSVNEGVRRLAQWLTSTRVSQTAAHALRRGVA